MRKDKLKILEVISVLKNRDGAEVFFASLCSSLANRDDVELYVVTLFDEIHESFKWITDCNKINFKTCHKKLGFDMKAAFNLRKIIKNIKPDIINTHLSVEPTLFLGSMDLLHSFKLIHTFHTVVSEEKGFMFKNLSRKKMISFIGISPIITQGIKNKYPLSLVENINNGIAMHDYQESSNQEKEFDIIMVAGFRPVKNHEFCVKSIAKSNLKLKVMFVGCGETQENILSLVDSLNEKDRFIFKGAVENVYPLLKSSKIFVLTSLYEGNPISILEAMACGLPVIAPKVGGIPDIVKSGRNGFLYEPNNSKDFIEKISLLLSNNNLYNQITQNNIIDSRAFDIDNTASNYVRFFIKNIKEV